MSSESPMEMTDAEIRTLVGHLLQHAEGEASRLRHNYIGTEHLFNGLTRIKGGITSRILLESGLDTREVRNAIRRDVGMGDDVLSEYLPFTPRAHRVLTQAVYLADDMGETEVTQEQLLLSLLQEGEGVAVRKIRQMGVDVAYWVEYLTEHLQLDDALEIEDFDDDVFDYFDDDYAPTFDFSDDDLEASMPTNMPTPLLDKYGRDLTEQARLNKLHAAIGREKEIRAVARTLTRSKKNNPLLLGDAGVGKTAVVEGLAWQIAQGTAPRPLRESRIIQVEIGTLVAGTSLRGQFEERLVGIVDEAKSSPGVILFIDEIHTIVGAGDTIDSNLDAANILKPALARGEISCIGATTFEEYRKAVAKDPALDRRFRTIDIGEPTVTQTLAIIENVYARYEEHHDVHIHPEARQAAVLLSDRYLPDRRLPDKALDLLDEACARVVIQSQSPDESLDGETRPVGPQHVREVLSEWTGIPLADLTADERARVARMDEHIKARVFGQEHAVDTVVDAIKTQRAGLGNPQRPTGVFLFIGPSGVGKTALAQAIAEFMFGDYDAMIRLDMSEFYDEHTAARLIGAPPGYKGTERGGQLTEALRRRPYSVVLLDEIEKAAVEVFDLFLQVFDEGRLTDALGATVDGRHAVWIMTSNIGSDSVGKGFGFMAQPDQLPDYSEELKRTFRPEFLNRIDEVVTFRPLDDIALDRILDAQLAELTERLDAQDMRIDLSAEARAMLLREGASVTEGARPLRRAIERLLLRPLSSALLDERFSAGDTVKVVVNHAEGKLGFRRRHVKPEEDNTSATQDSASGAG
ncbi:MAG: ATP-dependent Clp protease ATP-binding subunit [Anaerolineales bacterium]